MMTVVNLTAHPVSVFVDGKIVATFVPSGRVGRLREVTVRLGPLLTNDGAIPLTAVRYSDDVDDLPDPGSGVVYLVSRVLAAAVARADLVFPADEVRDASGRILGCRSLGSFAGDIGA